MCAKNSQLRASLQRRSWRILLLVFSRFLFHLIVENCNYSFTNEKCVDVDECSSFSKICPSHSKCVNTAGSAFCECENGFQMNENGFCDDFDECESEKYRCDENAKCINTDGSFKCDCRAGFIMKNGSCERKEINECVQKTHNCEQVCNDEVDGFYCSCFPGFYFIKLLSIDNTVLFIYKREINDFQLSCNWCLFCVVFRLRTDKPGRQRLRR